MDHEGLHCPNRPATPREQRIPDPRSRGPHLHIQTGRSKTERRRPRRQTNNRPLLRRLGRTTPGRNGRQRCSRSQTTRAACAQDRAAKGSEIMTFESMSQFLSSVAACAGQSAVRSTALALAVGSVLFATKFGHARLRLFTWTGVLYLAMMMPLLAVALPAITLPLLPPGITPPGIRPMTPADNASKTTAAGITGNSTPVEPAHGGLLGNNSADTAAPPARVNIVVTKETFNQGRVAVLDSPAKPVSATTTQLSWSGLAAIIYMLVAAILLARVVTGLILGRRLRANAAEIADPEVSWLLDQLCGQARRPRVTIAESPAVSVPLASGALR